MDHQAMLCPFCEVLHDSREHDLGYRRFALLLMGFAVCQLEWLRWLVTSGQHPEFTPKQ